MTHRLATAAAVLALCCAAPALAQTDAVGMAHVAAANQLGVLEYCQGRGDVGADAVAAERGVIAHLPASATSTDAAEALGRQGTLAAPNGAHMALSDMANQRGSSITAMCRQMGDATRQAAAVYSNGGPAGAMPQMPTVPGMPPMPAMPTMPAGMPPVPGMPSMPSTTQAR